MRSFINLSNPLSTSERIACFTVQSNNVTLNCNGFMIRNAPVAIASTGWNNITVKNCRITNSSSYGIYLNGTVSSYVNNVIVDNSSTGIAVYYSGPLNPFSNSLTSNRDGIYMHRTNSSTIQNFGAVYNTYGLYVNSSFGNLFSGGYVANNTVADIFASPDNLLANQNILQKSTCGITDAAWADSCTSRVSAQVSYYPIDACQNIRQAGNYSLQNNILYRASNCFTITASMSRSTATSILYNHIPERQAIMIKVIGASNVVVNDCSAVGFAYGFAAYNSTGVSVYNSAFVSPLAGISFNRVKGGKRYNNSVNYSKNSSIAALFNSSGISVLKNSFTGYANNVGLQIINSSSNKVSQNNERNGYLGLTLQRDGSTTTSPTTPSGRTPTTISTAMLPRAG